MKERENKTLGELHQSELIKEIIANIDENEHDPDEKNRVRTEIRKLRRYYDKSALQDSFLEEVYSRLKLCMENNGFRMIYKEFKDENPKLNVEITYKDFDNKDQTETINIPFNVYTKDEALKLGLIKKNNSMLYFGIIVFIILIWIIYRQTKKALKKRANKSGR